MSLYVLNLKNWGLKMGDEGQYIEPRIYEVLDATIAKTKNGYQLFKLKIRNHNNTFWATKLVPIKKTDRLHDPLYQKYVNHSQALDFLVGKYIITEIEKNRYGANFGSIRTFNFENDYREELIASEGKGFVSELPIFDFLSFLSTPQNDDGSIKIKSDHGDLRVISGFNYCYRHDLIGSPDFLRDFRMEIDENPDRGFVSQLNIYDFLSSLNQPKETDGSFKLENGTHNAIIIRRVGKYNYDFCYPDGAYNQLLNLDNLEIIFDQFYRYVKLPAACPEESGAKSYYDFTGGSYVFTGNNYSNGLHGKVAGIYRTDHLIRVSNKMTTRGDYSKYVKFPVLMLGDKLTEEHQKHLKQVAVNIDELRQNYLSKAPYPLDVTKMEGHLTTEEKSIISNYGYWFEAIWAGQVPLTTEKLKRFKRAKELDPAARNKFEDLWVRYNQRATPASDIENKIEDKSHTSTNSVKITNDQTVKRVSSIDYEAEIQSQIIEYLEAYIAAENRGENIEKWQPPFAPLLENSHFCAATQFEYMGDFNTFILSLSLWASGFTSNAWGTRKQWESMGANKTPVVVKQGIKAGAFIAVPTFSEDYHQLNGFIYRNVFNADQVEGYTPRPEDPPKNDVVRCKEADKYLNNMNINFQHGGGRAYYSTSGDYIRIPPEAAFKATKYSSATEGYYSTKFHEYAHATGHETRCKRDMSNEKTSYAFEELVAELSATILCRRFNISPQPREDHSKYIHSWLKSLKNDKTMIVEAMKKASTAISWMDRQQNA